MLQQYLYDVKIVLLNSMNYHVLPILYIITFGNYFVNSIAVLSTIQELQDR